MKKKLLIFISIIVVTSIILSSLLLLKNFRSLSANVLVSSNENGLIIKNNVAIFEVNTNIYDIEEITDMEVQVFDGESEIDKLVSIKTNELLKINNDTYLIAVLGDVKADGLINVQDIARSYAALSKTQYNTLSDAEKVALDANCDDKKNVLDLLSIYKEIGKEDDNTIIIDKESISINTGETDTLVATIIDEDLEDKTITWESSNENIAIVDQNGLVTGVANGTTSIKAMASNGKFVRCIVTVSSSQIDILPTSVSFEGDKTSMKVVLNNHRTLVPVVLPDNAVDKTVTWASTDNNVATVQDGVVSGVGLGTATITATTVNGLTASCEVEVVVHEESISIVKKNGEDLTELSFYENKTVTVYTAATPSNAYYTPVTWESSDPSVATVNENGEITSIKGGTTTITATSLHGKTDSISVTVKVMETVTLNRDTIVMNEGNSRTLVATVTPDNATYKSVTWESSNTDVATVDATGKVVAVGAGTATITASTRNSSATCEVTIRDTYEINDLSTSSSESAARANTEKLNNHLKIVANSDDYQKVKLKEGTYYFYIDIDTAISISSYKENKVVKNMDNIYLDLNNSKLKMLGTSDYRYYFFKINNVNNISVTNGSIVGDRKLHDYSVEHPDADSANTHEWGMAINIKDSTNVTIKNINMYDTTGDGIRIQDSMSNTNNTNSTSNIIIKNNDIHGVRRNGISIIAGDNITISNNNIYNIGGSYTHSDGTTKYGTDPKTGIDLERNKTTELIKNLTIDSNKIYNTGREMPNTPKGRTLHVHKGVTDFKFINNEIDAYIGFRALSFCTLDNLGNEIYYTQQDLENPNGLYRYTISGNTLVEGTDSSKVFPNTIIFDRNEYETNMVCDPESIR